MATHRSITTLNHDKLHTVLHSGDCVIDATAGNGHDTAYLARLIGPSGELHAIDLQAAALASTRQRLATESISMEVQYRHGDHADILQKLRPKLANRVHACVFNLGYLPGADKTITTTRNSTLRALDAAIPLLTISGVLSITCYPGHPEGAAEAEGVTDWANTQVDAKIFTLETYQNSGTKRPSPFLLWLRKT
jgi:hypothetical protein